MGPIKNLEVCILISTAMMENMRQMVIGEQEVKQNHFYENGGLSNPPNNKKNKRSISINSNRAQRFIYLIPGVHFTGTNAPFSTSQHYI